MKSTESLDVAGQPVDSPSTAGETGLLGDTSTLNNKRRRLIRGAVALAPVVLTLRSGALAAASCTGLQTATARTKPSGATRPGRIFDASPTPVPGDVCVLPNTLTACDTPGKGLTSSNLTTGNSEPVALYTNLSLPLDDNNPYLVCGTSTGGPHNDFIGKNIAILSSQSASSMVVGPG